MNKIGLYQAKAPLAGELSAKLTEGFADGAGKQFTPPALRATSPTGEA
jgi:hypothetical protein